MPREIVISQQTNDASLYEYEEADWDLFDEADEDDEVGTHPFEEAKEDEEVDMDMLPYEQVDAVVLHFLWEEESLGDHVREEAMRLCVRLQKIIYAGVKVRQIRGVRFSVLISSVALAGVFERDLIGIR